MGVDLHIRVRRLPKKSWTSFDIYDEKTIYLDRIFGRVYQNSIKGNERVLFKLKEKLNIDVDFLFKPDYYEYSTEDDNWILDMMEDRSSKDLYSQTIQKGQIESEQSWVNILWFLKKLRRFKRELQNSNNYHVHLQGWDSYFESKQFEVDIDKLDEILTELSEANIKEFTFDIF